MSLRFSPIEATAFGALMGGLGAVGGWISAAWKARADHENAQAQISIDREEAINQRVDGIFRAYDARIADLHREVGECRAEVDALRRQVREINEDRDLAVIAANTARAQADQLYVENQGLSTALKACEEQRIALLHQLGEKAATGNGHVKDQQVDRTATGADP